MTLPAATVADATRCPLCGSTNACAMERVKATGDKQPPCWCTRVNFSEEVLAKVPAAPGGKACICRACAESDS
jgi:uncharacterized Zn-binding protein involved in type VI secretion